MKTLEEMTVFDIDKRLYNSAYNINDAIKSNLGNTKLGIELSDIIVKEFKKATLRLQEGQHEEDLDQVKTDKCLWRARSVLVHKMEPLPCEERYSDVREFTVDEAVSWYVDWAKHLNDYNNDIYTVWPLGLFYKKDDEWVLYK